MSTVDFSARVMRCTRCRRYPSTLLTKRGRDPVLSVTPTWYPPRGWAGTEDEGPRTLLLVTLNPGSPQDPERDYINEHGLREGCCEAPPERHREHARWFLRRCLSSYVHPPPGHDYAFHRRSAALARACLRLLEKPYGEREWQEHVWFTDLYKCSTPNESSPDIRAPAIAACRPWLDEEIEMFQPALIVALGTNVQDELLGSSVNGLNADPRVVGFPHPSPANRGNWRRLADAEHTPFFADVRRRSGKPPLTAPQQQHFETFLEALGE